MPTVVHHRGEQEAPAVVHHKRENKRRTVVHQGRENAHQEVILRRKESSAEKDFSVEAPKKISKNSVPPSGNKSEIISIKEVDKLSVNNSKKENNKSSSLYLNEEVNGMPTNTAEEIAYALKKLSDSINTQYVEYLKNSNKTLQAYLDKKISYREKINSIDARLQSLNDAYEKDTKGLIAEHQETPVKERLNAINKKYLEDFEKITQERNSLTKKYGRENIQRE